MNDDYDRPTMTYEQAGIAAMLPGMIHMLTLMQGEIDRMKAMLLAPHHGAQNGAARPKIGRPLGSKNKGVKLDMTPELMQARKRAANTYWSKMTPAERTAEMQKRALRAGRTLRTPQVQMRSGPGGYWDKMTPEERAAEMRRRMRTRRKPQNRGGAASPKHPSNPNHPDHAAWVEKVRAAAKARRAA